MRVTLECEMCVGGTSTNSYFTENVTASIQSNKNCENTQRGNFCSRGGERSHMHVMKKREMTTFIHKKSFVWFWRDSPQWAMASSFTWCLDHTQRHTTVGMTPLDKRSARRRERPLPDNTQHITGRHPCPRWDSNPQSQQASGRRPTP